MTQHLDGLIVKEQSGFYWVETASSTVYMCTLRGRLKEEARKSDIAAIGDRVQISVLEIDDGTGVEKGAIETVKERNSALSRAVRTTGKRGVGQAEREHVIVANAVQAFFVFSVEQPVPNFRMLDRLLVTGEKSKIEKLGIVVNKIDLQKADKVREQFAPYAKMGYTVLYTSAIDGSGVDDLREMLRDKISVFTGPSGVGKTSLLNNIQPGLGREVREVGKRSKAGTHTTRDSALVKLKDGGYIADTPGIRYLTVWDVEPDELDAYFIDIAKYVNKCRFNNCTHAAEPGCAVQAAIKAGNVSKTRYENYLHLREELADTYI